ncbi:MAG: hypothetical protein CBD97_03675 [Pelagibacteraceae bacterium TMED237]|nr:MAG: hypothetical protein CBD97_03675 [Pelagibacteraceae bacterium TMED237]|tara:strand:- start:1145 stop:2509 length:1365 start_codon:yes stop_codon:yes gene_type:complete
MSIKQQLEEYIISKNNKIKISSQDIKKGDIFLALQGKNFHGNKFLKSSLKNDAKFCLTDNKNYIKSKKIIFVENLIKYLTNLAIKKRNLYKGKVIGITGSAGKTTLKETLAFFLKKNNLISYSQKSYNNELGVLISLLNLNLKSSFAIFELGTNNFGEIKYLTKIIKPSEIFITNIQSTHLENFKTKSNIAKEKSDIFLSKYNNKGKKLYLNIVNQSDKIIFNKAKNEKNIKVIKIGKLSNKYFIKDIVRKKNSFFINFSINKKTIVLKKKSIINFRLINLLFCYAFFNQNLLKIDTITNNQKFLKPVDGRGLTHKININNKKIKIIDESYNANPETIYQSVDYFSNIKKVYSKKILILGNMNELGKNTDALHLDLLHQIDKYSFKFVILCGEFFRRSIKKLLNPKNEFIYLENKNKIMNYLNKNIHNNDIILIKCSNSTEINKFTKNLLKKVI